MEKVTQKILNSARSSEIPHHFESTFTHQGLEDISSFCKTVWHDCAESGLSFAQVEEVTGSKSLLVTNF